MMQGTYDVSLVKILEHLTTWRRQNEEFATNEESFQIPGVKNTAHSGFEIQSRRHQKSKTRVSVVPQKGLMSSKH